VGKLSVLWGKFIGSDHDENGLKPDQGFFIDSVFPSILTAIFIFEIAFIIFANLFLGDYFSDFDTSVYYEATREVWRTKSILLKEFQYQRQLLVGTNVMLAAPLFGLIGNARVAYGIANCISTFIFVFVLKRLLNDLNLSKVSRIFTLCLILTLHAVHPLFYGGTMFVGSAGYVWTAICTVMLLSICIKFENGYTFKDQRLFCLIFILISISVSINSGLLYFACVIIPLILVYCFKFLSEEKFDNLKKPKYLFILISFFASLFGLAFYRILGNIYDVSRETAIITGTDNFVAHFQWSIIWLLQIMGFPMTTNSGMELAAFPLSFWGTQLMSVDGIFAIGKLFIFFISSSIFIFVAIKNYHLMYSKKSEHSIFICISSIVVIITLFVVSIVDMYYGLFPSLGSRYILPAFIVIHICFGASIDSILKYFYKKKWIMNFLTMSLSILLVITCVFSSLQQISKIVGEEYIWHRTDTVKDVLFTVDENDVSVIIANDFEYENTNIPSDLIRKMRGMSDDIPIII
jgi:hypothetical protein